jgi:hypothetical protein
MHVLVGRVHVREAANKRDNAGALTDLWKQKCTNIQPSDQYNSTQFQGEMLCLKAAQEIIST